MVHKAREDALPPPGVFKRGEASAAPPSPDIKTNDRIPQRGANQKWGGTSERVDELDDAALP